MITELITTKLIPILLTGIGFGLLVTVHEFGHFIFAKLFNIGVPVFSIGFGPSIFKKRLGSTEFRLSLIPLGGYCAIQGMSDPEAGMVDTDDIPSDPSQSFEEKSLWKKVIVILGGIFLNLAFAYATFISINYGTHQKTVATLNVSFVAKESAAEKAGITKGTLITGYNNVTFTHENNQLQGELNQFLATIKTYAHKTMSISVKADDGCISEMPVMIGSTDGAVGSLGIGLEVINTPIEGEFVYNSLPTAIQKGITLTNHYIQATANSLLSIFKQRSLSGLGGPLAIFTQIYKGAQSGLASLFAFLGTLSISLALMNLIPLGALDGGQLLFILIEGTTRRKLPEKLKIAVIIASWLLFLGLTLVLSYHDVVRLIQ